MISCTGYKSFCDRTRVSWSTSSIVISDNYYISVSLILSLMIDCKAQSDRLLECDTMLSRHFSGNNCSNPLNLAPRVPLSLKSPLAGRVYLSCLHSSRLQECTHISRFLRMVLFVKLNP